MFPHTALQCFTAVARHHGVDLAVERLVHDYALPAAEPEVEKLLRIAHDKGFVGKRAALAWDDLVALPARDFPLLLRLKSGNTIAAAGYRADTEEILTADPLATQPGQIPYKRAALEAIWAGDAVFLRRRFRITDEDQPFGLAWFVPEMLRQKSLFRDVVIAAFAVHALALALPLFFQIIIDKVLVHHTFSTLYVLTLGVVICVLFEAAFGFLRQYLMLYAGSKMDVRLAMRVFAHLTSLPVTFFERNLAGVLVQHMQQNRRIREFLTGRLFITLVEATALFVFVPVLFLYSWKLGLILLLYCAAIGAVIAVLIAPFRRRLLALYQAEAQRQGLLVETIHGMPTVKALALEPRRRRAWEERSAAAANMQFRVGKISAAAHSCTGLLEKLMLVTIIAVGATDVFTGAMSVGALVAFQMLSGRVSGPLVQIVALIHEYQEVLLSVRMLGEVMNQRSEGATQRGTAPQIRGDIEFDNVVFSYVPEARAVDRVTFRIPPGNTVGIVGRSGSGKTTLARLIQGLYAPQEGVIRFDGVNARDIDLFHLRRNIGVVLQETFLLHGTVRENIAAARADAALEEILAAARLAGATEFIERLPQGMDTMLVENGANLSGGQKQRLAIARALLTQPRILIFDEATSSLDPESEAIVQDNLAAISRGRTLIVITHRLSTLVRADAILVMEQGTIVDHGKHADLVSRGGTYQDLWRQQTRFVQG